VTLDRVICCYPDMEQLVAHAAEKARHVLGAVYPREVWWVRLGGVVMNGLMRLKRCPFRTFLHSPVAIEATLRQHGLERVAFGRTAAEAAVEAMERIGARRVLIVASKSLARNTPVIRTIAAAPGSP